MRERDARRELDAWRNSLTETAARASSAVPDAPTLIVGLCESRLARGAIERSTARDYRCSARALGRWFAGIPADMVTRDDVEAAISDMVAEGRVPTTVRKRMVALNAAFEDAVSRGICPSNPCRGVERPKMVRSPKNYLPSEERERLKAWICESEPSRMTVAASLGLWCALRAAAVCGTQLWDVDGAMLWKRRAIGVDDGETYVKQTKGRRISWVEMPEPCREQVARWVASPEGPREPTDWLIGRGDRWCRPNWVMHHWVEVAEGLKLVGVLGRRPTFHDLRHTYATVAIAGGVDVKTVASAMDHCSAAMTLDVYAVADPDAMRRGGRMMGSLL